MDRPRLEPPIGPGDQYVDQPEPTHAERRAAATNKRLFDRDTGQVPDRMQSALDHARKTNSPRVSPRAT